MDDTTIEVEGTEYDAKCALEAVERLTQEDGDTPGDERIEIVGNVAAQCDGDPDECFYLYNVEDANTLVDKTSTYHTPNEVERLVEEATEPSFADVVRDIAPNRSQTDPWSDGEADLDITAPHIIGQSCMRNLVEADEVAVRYVKRFDDEVRVGLSDER